MPTTPISGLRYPALTDDPNIPEDIQNLATDADNKVIPRFASAAARNAAITLPVEGQLAYLNDVNALTWYTGSSWQGQWTTYTPTWTASSINPDIGNGTLTGRYIHMPQLVIVEVLVICGTTTNGGTGVWFFSLPVTASAINCGGGGGFLLDSGLSDMAASTKMETVNSFRIMHATGSVSNGSPFGGWSSGDEVRAQITYSPA